MEHARALRGLPLTSCGPWHNPCPSLGLGFRSRQRPGRRAPRRVCREPALGSNLLQAYAPSPDSSSFLSNFFSMVMPAGRNSAALRETRAVSSGDPAAVPHRQLPAGHVALRSAQAQSALCASAQPGAAPGFNPLPAGEGPGAGPGVHGEGWRP